MKLKAQTIYLPHDFDKPAYVNYDCFDRNGVRTIGFIVESSPRVEPTHEFITSPSECSMMLPTREVFEACS